jgi:hypothetical protein
MCVLKEIGTRLRNEVIGHRHLLKATRQQLGTAKPAKVAPFAGGNEANVRKIAAGDFSNKPRGLV